jgi:hypothetical protein
LAFVQPFASVEAILPFYRNQKHLLLLLLFSRTVRIAFQSVKPEKQKQNPKLQNSLFFHAAIVDQLAIWHPKPKQQRTNKINQEFTTISYFNNPIRNYNQASFNPESRQTSTNQFQFLGFTRFQLNQLMGITKTTNNQFNLNPFQNPVSHRKKN